MTTKKIYYTENPATLILCTYTPDNKIHDIHAYFEEFLNLIKTAEVEYDEVLLWKPRAIDTSHFLTKGKLQELKEICEKNEIKQVICSKELTPLQERNLHNALDCSIVDRSALILEIFHKAAHSSEGKIQVEIAELEYLKTRLSGRGKELAQQAGFIGGKGPGETEKESLRRYYETKIKQSKKKLISLEKSRQTQRKKRLESNIPLVALVGYTNAGKSSVLNALTKSDILAEDKLFSTLDTTTRSLYLDTSKKILLSDTVGFISELPHHLIEAFKSTLDELKYANLILHVVDISNPMWKDHIEIAKEILNELGVKGDVLFVFNKSDLAKNIDDLEEEFKNYNHFVITETKTKKGITPLLEYIKVYKFN
ncbi:GTPase HflX [Candidatus Babeliales bacterium]|nr:GTPase HflX [Candidatus Babeliales bacterium]